MARTVADAALLLTALAGVDAGDPAGTGGQRTRLPPTTRRVSTPTRLKGKRFGVLRQAMGYHPDVDAAIETAIDAIKAAGAEVVDVKMPAYNEWNDAGVRGAALRVQGRPQRVPEGERLAARVARSADRVEQGATPTR